MNTYGSSCRNHATRTSPLALLLVLSACAGASDPTDPTSASARAKMTIQAGDNTLVAGMGGADDFGSRDLAQEAATSGDLDDGYWRVDLSAVFPNGINFFGTKYDAATNVFVGTNGYVTFGQGSTSFNPSGIQYSRLPIVAGFYCDVVYNIDASHRSTYGQGHVYLNVDGGSADPVVTLTYFAPAYKHVDKVNTFQIRLHRVASDPENGDQVGIELRYAQMQWASTDGAATSAAGWADGKATATFPSVPTAVYGTVKGSGTADIVNNATPDTSYSNTNPAVAGVYAWQPLSLSVTGGDPQSAVRGAQFDLPLGVNVVDLDGNPVEGATVTFSAPGSGATAVLEATTATTDAQGNASVHATAGSAAGSYVVTAFASGSGFSSGVSFHLTNTKSTPSAVLASSATPSAVGQSVQLTATVSGSPGTPTGQVTFKDGSTTLGTATLAAGVATYTTSSLAVGTHPITAVYGGDGAFFTATSDELSQVVVSATTSTALASSLPEASPGDEVTFTATVTGTPGTPSGTVTFMDGSAILGTGALDGSGVATYATSSLAVGTHEITAVYGGDATFSTSTSPAVSEVIDTAASATALSASPSESKSGQSVTLTATVTGTPGTPTGTVTFMDGGATLGEGELDGSGVATYATTSLAVGTHEITAVYGGDATFSTSTSAAATVVVSKSGGGSGCGCGNGGDAGFLALLGLLPLRFSRRRAARRTRA